MCKRFNTDYANAEDMVQSGFLRAWRYLDRFDIDESPDGSIDWWMYTVIGRSSTSMIRSLNRHRGDEYEEGSTYDMTERSPDQDTESMRIEAVVRDEIRKLDPGQQEVLKARAEELTYKEIADRVGIPVGTVMSRLYRGRRALLERMMENTMLMEHYLIQQELAIRAAGQQGTQQQATYNIVTGQ
jgi:RNA polymerase sigma-70 factor (ECF subfamily)